MATDDTDPYREITSGAATEPEIEEFWSEAKRVARLGQLDFYLGSQVADTVVPPAWTFGDSAALADVLLDRVIAGTKTATSSAVWGYQSADLPLPEVGDLAIVLDGSGSPRALIVTTAVEVCPFAQVDEQHALAEGEGNLEQWREDHRRFFTAELREGDAEFTEDLAVVLERFRVLALVREPGGRVTR